MHSKLAGGHLPLQDMIAATISNARTKLAAAEEKEGKEKEEKSDKVKKLVEYEKKEHGGKVPSVKEEEEEKKASAIDWDDPSQVEKLAAALEFIGDELEKDADSVNNGGETRQGGQQLATNSAVGGKQDYSRDAAKHQVPTSTGLEKKPASGPAATAVPDTLNSPPVPLNAAYPKTGVLQALKNWMGKKKEAEALEKQALAVSTLGHKYDSNESKAKSDFAYAKAKNRFQDRAAKFKNPVGFGSGVRGLMKTHRHQDHVSAQHEKGKNVWNPFAGSRTPSRRETAEAAAKAPAATPDLKKEAFSVTPEGHAYDAEKAAIMGEAGHKLLELSLKYKGFGEGSTLKDRARFGPDLDIDPGHQKYVEDKHKAGKNAYNPLGGVFSSTERMKAMDGATSKTSAVNFILNKIAETATGGMTLDSKSGEGLKPSDTPVGGNNVRSILESNQSVINMKKIDGKRPQKKMLSEVLTEPALTSSTDSKVQDNLRNASQGGVKIAMVKAYLQKIAEDTTDPRHEKLKQALEVKSDK